MKKLLGIGALVLALDGCDDRPPLVGMVKEELGNAQQMAEAGEYYSPKSIYGLVISSEGKEYRIDVKLVCPRWSKPLERLAYEIEAGDTVEIRFFDNNTEIKEDNTVITTTNAVIVR